MKQSSLFSLPNTRAYCILAFWIFLILFGGSFIIKDALPYFAFNEDVLGRWWTYKWSLIGHVSGGLLALIIGPFQFWKSLRKRNIVLHRILGRVYLIAILIGSISGTHLAWTSALKIHWTWSVSLQGLALAWFVTSAMAYISVRRKRISQHKDWMIRSYIVTFGFVSFRFLNGVMMDNELGSFVEVGPTAIWIAWAIPLLIGEVFINWNKK